MACVKTVDEGAESAEKRKPVQPEEDEIDPNKRQKIDTLPEQNGLAEKISSELDKHVRPEDENGENEDVNDEEDEVESEIVDEKGKGVMIDLKGKGKMVVDDGDDDDENENENEDEDEDDGDEDDDEDGSSDDSSDSNLSGDEVDGSDWEDDPLLEVDLNNIVPSRTRRGGGRAQRGVRFLGDDPSTGKDV